MLIYNCELQLRVLHEFAHKRANICLTCRVLPTPRKNLTESQTAELIRVAALPPDRRLAAYKAVLQQMVSGWQLFRQWGVNVSTTLMQVTTTLESINTVLYATL